MAANDSIMSLDVGGRRIGVAVANSVARIARPLTTIANNDHVFDTLKKLIEDEDVSAMVVGLPRGLDGQATAQTEVVDVFVRKMEEQISLPVFLQDEAVTSVQAEKELKSRGKPYEKGDIDALAATYILEDFLRSHEEVKL